MTDTTAAAPGLRLTSPRGRAVLLATVLGSGLAQLGGTVINVALPSIGEDLGAGLASLQWMVNGYTLALAALLLLGGSMGDRWGRRRVFQAGVVVFGVAAAVCALAPTAEVLVGARTVQGIGAALLTPGSLAILEAVFREEDRAEAVGSWSGLSGIASALGPVIGGALVGLGPWGWRLTFLLSLPLAVAVLVVSRSIPETRDEESQGRLDLPGAALAAASLAALVLALTTGPSEGWPPAAQVSLAAGAALMAVFFWHEARTPAPLMPLSLFRSRQLSAVTAVTLLLYGALSGVLFLLPLHLQTVAGLSPVASGAALLPMTVVMLLLSGAAGRWSQRIGVRLPLSVGPVIAGAGLALLALVGPGRPWPVLLAAISLFGLGMAITVAPLTATALSAVPPHMVGVASAINNDVARLGGLLAVALLPVLVGLDEGTYRDPALLDGAFDDATLLAAAVCLVAGAISLVFLRPDATVGACAEAREAGTRTHVAEVIPTARR